MIKRARPEVKTLLGRPIEVDKITICDAKQALDKWINLTLPCRVDQMLA
jgi:hypothetical protein